MDINIKVEIIPSPSLVTIINALLLFNHPNPTFVGTTKSEVAKNVEVAEKAAASVVRKVVEKASKKSEVEEEPTVPSEEVKQAKKNSGVTIENLRTLATTLKTETDFDIKAWLTKRNVRKMGEIREDDYSECFDDLMKIAGENNVQTF